MKRVIEHVRNHGQKIHSHVKKHHKKYLFGIVSAALLFKLIPLLVASVFTTKLHFSFADDLGNNGSENSEITVMEDGNGGTTGDDDSGTGDDDSGTGDDDSGTGDDDSGTGDDNTGSIIPLSLEQLSPVPGTYTGPSIEFTWSGNVDSSYYDSEDDVEHQIRVYSGSECTGDVFIGRTVGITGSTAILSGFLSGEYCWTIGYRFTEEDSTEELTGTISTGFTVVDPIIEPETIPLSLEQLSPIPGIYTGPSVEFTWSGNATAEDYSGYQINVYSGNDCTGNIFTGKDVSVSTTGVTLTGFSSGNYCWSISATLSDELTGTVSTGFTVVDPLPASMNGQCDVDDIKVLSPKTGSYIRGTGVISWQFIGDDCDSRDIIVAVHTGVSGGYIDIRSGTIPTYTGYTYDTTGISEGRLALYVSSGDDKFSLMANNEYQIDNVKPAVTGVNYRFDPRTTGGLFGLNHTIYISFTGEESLTGITVNVMGRNANLYDKSGDRYEYALSGFTNTNSNPGNLMFNISYQDLAGNTGYYEKSDTGYTADYIRPNLSGGIKLDLKSGDSITASIDLTKTGKVELNYVQSGTNKGGTKTGSYSLSHKFTINELKKNKIYKYTVLVEDKAGNKSYFGSWFSISGNNIVSGSIRDLNSNDMITEVGFTNTGSILSSLKDQLNAYNNCKNNIRYRTGMAVPIQYTDNNKNTFTYYTLSIKRPVFNSGTLEKKVYTLVSAIAENLGKMSKLSTTGYKNINEDLNNYIIAVKLAKDSSDSCSKHHLSNYYGSKFIKTLKKYGLIK